jgi:alkylation response protein AidB-like acyl-CoA dehydrogenase
VQHLCADMLRTVELGRAAGYYACWALDDASPEEAHRAATLARAFAADAFPQLGGTAIQVFGGIGFTWEPAIHRYYKRLLSVAQTLGTASDHLEELATLAID